MNFLVATSRAYFRYLTVMLTSLYLNHADCSVAVYVLHTELLDEDIDLLTGQAASYGCTVHPVKVDLAPVKSLSTNRVMSHAAYLRMYAIDVLPREFDRILYMDADIIVRKPLTDLFSLDMDGYAVAACEDSGLNSVHYKTQLGIPCEQTYFNSGVMLMNLKEMRGDGITLEKLLEIAKTNNRRGICFDQDILNLALGAKLLKIPEEQYNCSPSVFDQHYGESASHAKAFGSVIHYYQQDQRPWNVPVSLKSSEIHDLWWHYAEKSPFDSQLREAYENGLNERLGNQNVALRLYFGTMLKWMKTENRRKKMEHYLLSRAFRTIAIYGANPFQDILCSDLKDSKVKIAYILDSYAKGRINNYEIRNCTNVDDVDAVIITAFAHKKEIVDVLNATCPVVSFPAIINEICKSTD
jgi:lipopolysaccharide biosynthesis glycosyltransferase